MQKDNPSSLIPQQWLDGPFDETTKAEIRRLLKENPQELSDAFFKDLSFGTGGMRGIMGVGTNRMNIYTIRKATQGLANYLKKHASHPISAFIGYDVRHHSKEFAEETARVLAGNGIHVFLSKEICPTPLVSFGCRHFKCQTAIMITASHNPPQYNGYKVYWSDGGQIVPPHDKGIIQEVQKVKGEILLSPLNSPLIRLVDEEIDKAYLSHLKREIHNSDLHILYSPLHGTGIRLMQKALAAAGFTNVDLIEEQSIPDGNFSTVRTPNPEEKESLELGIQKLVKTKADLLLATDPDADRIGVVCKGPHILTGNQIACILLEHICKTRKLPSHATFVKSIVTTELFKKIGESHGGICIDVLTGFKYIGAKIADWEQSNKEHQYIFGAEESYGYLFGTFVRDKDAISTGCLIAEAAAIAKMEGKTLFDQLHQLYKQYGIHRELLINLAFADSEEGMIQMQGLMKRLRNQPISSILGKKVVRSEDFLLGISSLPPSDVLRLWLEDDTKIVIRPSGTEPKIKLYLEVSREHSHDLEHEIQEQDRYLETIAHFFKTLFAQKGKSI